MTYKEEKRDLFSVGSGYTLAHCISADYALGAGIAVQFNRRYSMGSKLNKVGTGKYPDCILIDGVLNIVTKKKYWMKPTNQSMRAALELMKDIALENKISNIAMPKIGAGLDRLPWGVTSEAIKSVFEDTDINILICKINRQ